MIRSWTRSFTWKHATTLRRSRTANMKMFSHVMWMKNIQLLIYIYNIYMYVCRYVWRANNITYRSFAPHSSSLLRDFWILDCSKEKDGNLKLSSRKVIWISKGSSDNEHKIMKKKVGFVPAIKHMYVKFLSTWAIRLVCSFMNSGCILDYVTFNTEN